MEKDCVVAECVQIHRVQLKGTEQDLIGRIDVADALQYAGVLPQCMDLLPLVAVVTAFTIPVIVLVIALVINLDSFPMVRPIRGAATSIAELL